LDVAPDGRIFVAQQNGVILVLENDVLLETPFATLDADGSGERGLGGITLDPEFEENGFIYVYYTAASPESHNRMSRLTADGNQMVPGSEVVLLELPNLSTLNNANWHMGGAVEVGPDGMLYVAIGEHNMPSRSQLLTNTLGKILRIGRDGTIPTDNPFYDTTTGINRAIWAYGLRNPYTMAFDPDTDRLFINDVGAGKWEEIVEGTAGSNYGWPLTEGFFDPVAFPTFKQPIHAYSHEVGCAITGGAFYSPVESQFPEEYEGMYFYAEFCNGELRVIDPDAPETATTFLSGAQFPIGIELADDGSMYYLDRGIGAGGADGTDLGSVHKIQYVANIPPTIVLPPEDLLVSVGQTATFQVNASGTQPLEYLWQRKDAGAAEFSDVPGATENAYSFGNVTLADQGAEFRVKVSNHVDVVFSEPATLSVTTNAPPVAAIDLPLEGLTYNAGDTIHFSGTASDPEDGALSEAQMTWSVVFHHHDHTHPFIAPMTGEASGSFVVPVTGETDSDVYYRIHLKVTDSIGLVQETFRDVTPNLSQITLASNIEAVSVALDGQPKDTPLAVVGVINLSRTLEASRLITVEGRHYVFVGWSDGEAEPLRTISFPSTPVTYTAEYLPTDVIYASDLPFATQPVNGWGPVERDMSNGGPTPGDGTTITLQGKTFAKGLGVLANSRVQFDLTTNNYSRFMAEVGVDDHVGGNGSVVFEVWLDGVRVYNTARLTGNSPIEFVDVDVSGAETLLLVVTNGGDGSSFDESDWADAKLVLEPFVPGDANGDWIVDLVDFNTLKVHFGMPAATRQMGDFDGSGTVSLPDFQLLRMNYGTDFSHLVLPRTGTEQPLRMNERRAAIDLALAAWDAHEEDEVEGPHAGWEFSESL
jgi:glucose/arabinose dehydrogenase